MGKAAKRQKQVDLNEAIERTKGNRVIEAWPPGQRKDIALRDIDESVDNTRKDFGELQELAESLKHFGVLQPVLVRPNGKRFELIAGARRYRAAKLAGLEVLPAFVHQVDAKAAQQARIVENVQRKDCSALEEAQAYRRLQELSGVTSDEVASQVGKSKSWVVQRLKLLELGPEGRKAVLDGRIDIAVAVPLARRPKAVQAETLERLLNFIADNVSGEPTSVKDQLEYLLEEDSKSLKGAPFDTKDAKLHEAAGACSACPKNSANGPADLFDSIEKKTAWCTDTACYAEKCRLAWKTQAAKFSALGAKVLSVSEGAKLFAYDGLGYGSRYVEAQKTAPDDKKKRSWSALVRGLPKEKRPQLYVAPDKQLKPRELYDRDEATKAIADELGLKWAEDVVERIEEKQAKADPEMRRKLEAESDALDKVLEEVMLELAEAIAGDGLSHEALRFLATERLSDWNNPYLKKLGVKDALKWAVDAPDNQLFAAIIVANMVDSYELGSDETFLALAKAHGVDIKARVAEKLSKVGAA